MKIATSTLTCKLNALTAAERKKHTALSRKVLAAFGAPEATADGWTISLPIEMLADMAKWIDGERKCCPFLRFAIVVEPGGKTARLTLTGREGVKEFLAAEFKL